MKPNFIKHSIYSQAAIFIGLLFMPNLVDAKKDKNKEDGGPGFRMRAERGRMHEDPVELTESGKLLQARYAAMHAALKQEIENELPQLSGSEKATVLSNALDAHKAAYKSHGGSEWALRKDPSRAEQKYKSLLKRLEDNPDKLAEAEKRLKQALAMPDGHEDKEWVIDQAKQDLESRKKDIDKLPGKVASAKAEFEKVKAAWPAEEPKVRENFAQTTKELNESYVSGEIALKKAGVDGVIASDKLDAKLARFVAIEEAKPYWLAVYAQQGMEHEKRIERLLSNESLLVRMLVADGAYWGKYPQALEIYENILKTSSNARGGGVFGELALAVALEHAVPIGRYASSSEEEDDEDGKIGDESGEWLGIDPVKRYLSFEKAYLDGELDSGFKTHDAWSLRMVINGNESDSANKWGREMLRSYRPDIAKHPSESLRYSMSVATEISYTSLFMKMKWDRPELQQYQNILANGGICGRRAFFGRFILRSFGVPTNRRSQKGHAALVRWTSHGWVPYLGGGWGAGNSDVKGYYTDLDFLASTQARADKKSFIQVKRAQWIGRVFGEQSIWGFHKGKRKRKGAPELDPWHTVSVLVQNSIIKRLNPETLQSVGEDIGESDEALGGNEGDADSYIVSPQDKQITTDANGVITIPAVACINPSTSTDGIMFMPSNLGGSQLHYSRHAIDDIFEYKIEVPKSGKYQLTSKLITPAWKQHLYLKINEAENHIDIALPYTVGLWGDLEPVELNLREGENVLSFSRGHYYMRGISIHDFKLTPVK